MNELAQKEQIKAVLSRQINRGSDEYPWVGLVHPTYGVQIGPRYEPSATLRQCVRSLTE